MGGKVPEQPGSARSEFIKERFRHYYSSADISFPNNLEQREFGILTEKAGMWRHIGFKTGDEVNAFLVKQAPPHVYHSSAYYERPNARTMDEKGWKGADLIFDLDADHIQGTEKMTMEEMLAAVKVQFVKLLYEFLLDDFGFDEKDVKVVFSGGRGYHAHIRSEKVLRLNSHERREIVDYITCPDMDINTMLVRNAFDTKNFKGHISGTYNYSLFPTDKPGWKGKVSRSVIKFLDRMDGLTEGEILAELMSFKGIGQKRAEQIYSALYLGKPGTRGVDNIRNNLNLNSFREDSARDSFIQYIINTLSVDLGGETDEPVTSDVKRLIRLPGSLHGKTGLMVMTLDPESLRAFEPLRDAVWGGFARGSAVVTGTVDASIKLKGEKFKVANGAEAELPEFAALFFLCQKKCDIPN